MDIYEIRQELNQGLSIYDIKMRVTFYARVSTEKDEQAHSLQNQIDYFESYIKENKNWTYVTGYIDEGISGTSVKKRESFLRMISDARKNAFDFVITKEISRFSRNTLDSIQYTQELLHYGVGVHFQADNITTFSPDAELRLTIMSSIAQDEVRKISERVKFGFRRAIDKGVVLGSSNIWGYKKEDGRLIVDEEEAEIIKLIFTLYGIDKLGIRGVCRKLSEQGYKNSNGNSFSFSTVRGILSNPKYKGYYCGNKTHKYDYKLNKIKNLQENEWIQYKDAANIPPIVSEELWEQANKLLQIRCEKMTSGDKTSYQNKYALSGKIFCSVHNTAYYRTVYHTKSEKKEVWQCKEYNEKGKAGCELPSVYSNELYIALKQIFDSLPSIKNKIINDLISIYEILFGQNENKKELEKYNKELCNLQAMKEKLLNLYLNNFIDEADFLVKNHELRKKAGKIEAAIAGISNVNKSTGFNKNALKLSITNELEHNSDIYAALLKNAYICNTDENKKIKLILNTKLLKDKVEIVLKRSKNTSVCSLQYI